MHAFVFFFWKKFKGKPNMAQVQNNTISMSQTRKEEQKKRSRVRIPPLKHNTVQNLKFISISKGHRGSKGYPSRLELWVRRKLAGDALHQQKTITGDGINKLSANHETASAKNDEFGDILNNQRIARSMRRAIRYPQPST